MAKSSKLFRFGSTVNISDNATDDQSTRTTNFGRDKNGTYVINNSGSLTNQVHELTHGAQIAAGEVDVRPGTTEAFGAKGPAGYSNLEHDAYSAGYGIDGDAHLGFGDNSTPVCGLDNSNFNDPINVNATTPPKP